MNKQYYNKTKILDTIVREKKKIHTLWCGASCCPCWPCTLE